jgi:hypothetical protein
VADILGEVDDILQQMADIILKLADIELLHPNKDFLGNQSRLLTTEIKSA